MADDDSDGSDEWGVEELVIPSPGQAPTTNEDADATAPSADDDDYWKVEPKPKPIEPSTKSTKTAAAPKPSEPMIIVDMTQLDSSIHSKFDKNAVSDSAAASGLRKRIEARYETYAKDAELLSAGTVLPCGSSVYREALVRLRDERPGHYFAPIFPPKKK